MQYRVKTVAVPLDMEAIEQAIGEVDPAAVSDLDPAGDVLRVSTVLGGQELLSIINQAGYVISMDQLERMPSDCCGGCGG